MTISAYTGLQGQGKSYGVVENVIVPALKAKRPVFTNIPMHDDECLKRFGMTVTPFTVQDLIDDPEWFNKNAPGALVIIDEVWRLWPAGQKTNNVREEDKAFLAEHRHLVGENGLSCEVILVTQDLSQISSFARCLVENTFHVTKLSAIGVNSRFRVDVYHGPVTGTKPPIAKRQREIHGKFKKEIYALYKSHTKSATGLAGDESRVDDRFNVLKGGSIKVGLAAVTIFAVIVYFGMRGLSEGYGASSVEEVKQASVESVDASVRQPVQASADPVPAEPAEPKPRKKNVFKFLSEAEAVYIVFNNGHFPNIHYRYKVLFKDHEATFESDALASLDYHMEPVNECMVKITGPDFEGFAMCQRQEEKKTWFEQTVTPAAAQAEST